MSATIVDHAQSLITTHFNLVVGRTYVTRDQEVITITEHREWLEGEPVKMVRESWTGSNGIVYGDSKSESSDDSTKKIDGPYDILLEVNPGIDLSQLKEAFEYIRKAEAILNPLKLSVLVTPTGEEPSEAS